MNLEDFKSFRRVLIPSEVGSIPTHSRQSRSRVLALALAWFLGLTVSARAAGDATAWNGPDPFQRAVRSAVFPAWGQLTNGKNRKAAVLFSVQAYLYTRIIKEGREGKAAEREAARLESLGADHLAADASATDHFDRRRNLLFWAIVAGFYGAIDAYIDAHLGDFDQELEDGRALFGRVDPARRSVELGMRF